jgi:putative toxin-antitoxin system antitoxin component (TIGR02293 family)
MPLKRVRGPRRRNGGFASLVAKAPPWQGTIDVIRSGLPARVVDDMVEYLEVPKSVVFAVLDTPESTAHRLIKDDRRLESAASERVLRVAETVREAEEVFGGRAPALRWLKTANVALGGATPLSLLDTAVGTAEVRRILSAISYGGAY